MNRSVVVTVGLTLLAHVSPSAEQWPQFRGSHAGVADDHPTLPESWSETDNIVWSTDIPGQSWSSPVVWDDHVFIATAISGGTEPAPLRGLADPNPENGEMRSSSIHRWVIYDVARPQDVAFLPDGRILVADGLDNHRVVILDREGSYLSEFGGFGEGPGQFNGVHALGVGPRGLIFALDRSGGRINVFRTTDDPAEVEFVDVWSGFTLPLDIIVNDEHLWITDLGPLRFVKLDFEGNQLYTWNVPRELPDGYLEVHTFSVDSNGNLYGGDNQYGRTQKFVPKPGADPALLIGPPWVAR